MFTRIILTRSKINMSTYRTFVSNVDQPISKATIKNAMLKYIKYNALAGAVFTPTSIMMEENDNLKVKITDINEKFKEISKYIEHNNIDNNIDNKNEKDIIIFKKQLQQFHTQIHDSQISNMKRLISYTIAGFICGPFLLPAEIVDYFNPDFKLLFL